MNYRGQFAKSSGRHDRHGDHEEAEAGRFHQLLRPMISGRTNR